MPRRPQAILRNSLVREALRQAWRDSQSGSDGGHEEGGFVVQDATRELDVVRWPKGVRNSILVPAHADCAIEGKSIVASFHTHPNTGTDFLQEPSETDKRAVRDDPDLKGAAYVGEFVIARETIYLITPNGQVREVADPSVLLVHP
jgi:proteasome lid subunit RPN8/RPN11